LISAVGPWRLIGPRKLGLTGSEAHPTVPKDPWACIWPETGRMLGDGRHAPYGPGHEETGRRLGNRSVRLPRTTRGKDYLELLVDVRRQRVQTSAFVATPF